MGMLRSYKSATYQSPFSPLDLLLREKVRLHSQSLLFRDLPIHPVFRIKKLDLRCSVFFCTNVGCNQVRIHVCSADKYQAYMTDRQTRQKRSSCYLRIIGLVPAFITSRFPVIMLPMARTSEDLVQPTHESQYCLPWVGCFPAVYFLS